MTHKVSNLMAAVSATTAAEFDGLSTEEMAEIFLPGNSESGSISTKTTSQGLTTLSTASKSYIQHVRVCLMVHTLVQRASPSGTLYLRHAGYFLQNLKKITKQNITVIATSLQLMK